MKRRSLLVGSALASIGALLGVGKVTRGSDPIAALGVDPETKRDAVHKNIWDYARDIEPGSNLDVDFPIGLWMSGYEIQQLLDPSAEIKYALPMDRIIRPLVIDPSPEWLEMNANQPNPQPYRLSGPDSRRAGI